MHLRRENTLDIENIVSLMCFLSKKEPKMSLKFTRQFY